MAIMEKNNKMPGVVEVVEDGYEDEVEDQGRGAKDKHPILPQSGQQPKRSSLKKCVLNTLPNISIQNKF